MQRAVEQVLKDFERIPSANQLYLHLEAEAFQLPVVPMAIMATDLSLPEVERAIMSLKAGHIRPLPDDPRQLRLC